jgi:general secretion pathway protein G
VEIELHFNKRGMKDMNNTRKAFTMIEMIFVIVVLGILASVAVSKMAVTRDDAMMTKGRSDVSAIRSAISLKRSTNMMTGNGLNPDRLDALASATSNDGDPLFDYDTNSTDSKQKLLDYPIYSKDKNGHWKKKDADTYVFKILNTEIDFDYDSDTGSFDCNHTVSDAKKKKYCKSLTE